MGRGKRPNHRIEVRSEVIVTGTNCDNARWVGSDTGTQTSDDDGPRSTVSTQTTEASQHRSTVSTQASDEEISEANEANDVNEASQGNGGRNERPLRDRPHICEYCTTVFTTERSVIRHYASCANNPTGKRGQPLLATVEQIRGLKRASSGRPRLQ